MVSSIVTQIEEALVLTPEGGWVEKGGPGSGHWGHRGRKGKHGGSAPSKGVAPSATLVRMMPGKNLEDLELGPGGSIWGATLREKKPGEGAHGAMYNPRTDTLVVGDLGHTHLHTDYVPEQRFDDFVKMHLGFTERKVVPGLEKYVNTVHIYLNRHQAKDTAEAWNMAFDSAKALKRAGVPGDVKVIFDYWGALPSAAEMLLKEV